MQCLGVLTIAFPELMEINHMSKLIMILKKNPTNIMNLLKSLVERVKSVRILKKGKNCNART